MRKVLLLLILVAALVVPFHAAAASSNIVISAVYPGGGLSGATYTNDYIELYNLSSSPVDVTGWKVQYADPSTAFSGGDSLTGSILAHKYYLVAGASDGAVGSALPTPDVMGTDNLALQSGKVRVIDGSSSVIDLLGYGPGADEYETNRAPGDLQHDSALVRKDGGCVDTDDNSKNFVYAEPNTARNSLTAAHACTPNTPPTLDHIGDKIASTRHELTFTVTASDTDGDPLSFSASNLPGANASFDDAETHQFTWTPQPGEEGTHRNVHFEVSDGLFSAFEDITITVYQGANTPPVMDPLSDETTHPGKPLAFAITATDADGDGLAYSASNLPPGALFDDESHSFSWTPTVGDLGSYPFVRFAVTDGQAEASRTITINVTTNTPPTIDPVGDKKVRATRKLTFVVNGSDPDGDELTFSASNLPRGATFDPVTRTFTWRPKRSQRGVYPNVTFTVDDGLATAQESITITVRRSPR